jgi:hypothetical protein
MHSAVGRAAVLPHRVPVCRSGGRSFENSFGCAIEQGIDLLAQDLSRIRNFGSVSEYFDGHRHGSHLRTISATTDVPSFRHCESQ